MWPAPIPSLAWWWKWRLENVAFASILQLTSIHGRTRYSWAAIQSHILNQCHDANQTTRWLSENPMPTWTDILLPENSYSTKPCIVKAQLKAWILRAREAVAVETENIHDLTWQESKLDAEQIQITTKSQIRRGATLNVLFSRTSKIYLWVRYL